MKMAIATVSNQVSGHFGHCDGFTVYTINDNKVISKEFLQSPTHQTGVLPKFLADNDVNSIVAGGMGKRAQDIFNSFNIDVIVGVSGDIDQVVETYLKSELKSTNSICDEHQHLKEDSDESDHKCEH
ncbi:NifB/NifX family molybdenum-iron cluster-binding protein [Clostridiaceae bacterium HSG29]|nr:NifB/NifX family molybdenum-iron cluster-binding protein [Clostridiaceae bacterium HSG29]